MEMIRLEAVNKAYDGKAVLRDLSLTVEEGELLAVIGRSGCGKTTALKLVNALVKPDSGRVLVRGGDVALAEPAALRRSIGYVIQNVGLFPHLSVEKNIAYVPSISGDASWRGAELRRRASALLEQVGLEPELSGRSPRTLSGGQRQRVGIARALAASPDIMLMDEPFGAVDEITRTQLQNELLRLHRERGLTIMLVTHDISEALRLATRVLVLGEGCVEQCDTPERLMKDPATPFVRRLVGSARSAPPEPSDAK